VTIVVNEAGGEVTTVEIRVAASSDDAEGRASGGVWLTSTDLDLGHAGTNQTVGMRFNGVDIPRGPTIVNAYVQFQVDETNSGATSLTIRKDGSFRVVVSRTVDDGGRGGSRSVDPEYSLGHSRDCEPARLVERQLAADHYHRFRRGPQSRITEIRAQRHCSTWNTNSILTPTDALANTLTPMAALVLTATATPANTLWPGFAPNCRLSCRLRRG
jgi:hypothetical protein